MRSHLMDKARDAKRGGKKAWCVQSTGERLAVAMILNKPDWIKQMGYTLPQAIERIGAEWLSMIPMAAQVLDQEAL